LVANKGAQSFQRGKVLLFSTGDVLDLNQPILAGSRWFRRRLAPQAEQK
jgi:hypothetical protein